MTLNSEPFRQVPDPARKAVSRPAVWVGDPPSSIGTPPLFQNPAGQDPAACLEFKLPARPPGEPPRQALVSYLTAPFDLPPDHRLEFSHSGLARSIVRVLLEMGYEVDVIDYTNQAFRSTKKYDLFIGHGGINWRYLSENVVRDAVRIFFSTGMYWKDFNQAEAARFADFERRRGLKLPYDRWIHCEEDSACDDADGIITLGNQRVADSYRRFPCCLPLNNGVYADDHFDPAKKDFNAGRKRFLFFSGRGNVHRGLDLLIEAFSTLEAELFCCTAFDPAFLKVYEADLASHRNIHLLGWVEPRSEPFYRLMEACNGLIFPSCAEGSPGSVAVAMNQGLIPIVSQASGIDPKDFGLTLAATTPASIAETVRWVMAQPVEWHREHAVRTRQEALEHYSEERFLVNFQAAVGVIVKHAPWLRASKRQTAVPPAKKKKRWVIDGLIFQVQARRPVGISRVWKNLLPALMQQAPEYEFILLRRGGHGGRIPGLPEIEIPLYQLTSEAALEADDALLGRICRELQAEVFMSTYYTRAPAVRNVQMIYDMIPELFHFNLDHPELRAKRRAIAHADSFVCISHSTRNDLLRLSQVPADLCQVAHCGVAEIFRPMGAEAMAAFRQKYGLHRPYLVLAGSRGLYKNAVRFFEALAAMPERQEWQVLAFGSEVDFWPEELPFAQQCHVVSVPWMSDEEMAVAYSGALALVHPSRYEGFGLPVAEAMACGCPIITTNRSSLPEVGGDAPIYINPDAVPELTQALRTVAAAEVRAEMSAKGLRQAASFQWSVMADKVAERVRAAPVKAATDDASPWVTAIVSTYKSERFMRACLEDLEAQTLADRLEILVIDSASPENEKDIVEEFQRKYSNIRYVRTPERETVYAAWNRAIRMARGKYLTNANTDDRHAPDAYEKLVNALEAHPEAGLVYADSALTTVENDTILDKPVTVAPEPQSLAREMIFRACCVGSQPLWRKTLHERFGLFDAHMISAGDYEFWLRVARDVGILHLPEVLGLYLDSPLSVEHRNLGAALWESEQARVRYWRHQWGGRPIREERFMIRQRYTVSIVIATRDRPRELRRALHSVLQQTYPYYEIMVVNAGRSSLDAFLSNVQARLSAQATCVQLKLDGLPGLPEARAAGIRAARGDVVAYLEESDVWKPEHLEMLVIALQSSEYALAYTSLPCNDGSKTIPLSSVMHRKNMSLEGCLDEENVMRKAVDTGVCVRLPIITVERSGPHESGFFK